MPSRTTTSPPPPTPPCEVGAGGDAGRVGGRRGRIGPKLMRHAYLDMFKRYGQQDANEILFSYFFSRKKETRSSFYFSRGQRTDGRTGKRKKQKFIRPEPNSNTNRLLARHCRPNQLGRIEPRNPFIFFFQYE
jgi:hypothetical protein